MLLDNLLHTQHHFLCKPCVDSPRTKHTYELRRKDGPDKMDTLDEDDLLERWDDSEGDETRERSDGDIYAYEAEEEVLIRGSISR